MQFCHRIVTGRGAPDRVVTDPVVSGVPVSMKETHGEQMPIRLVRKKVDIYIGEVGK